MAEGLSSSLYNHFLGLLWGDNGSTYLDKADSGADSEWESFCNVIAKMSGKSKTSQSDSVSHSSWEFLIKSKYSQKYIGSNYVVGALPELSFDLQRLHSSGAVVADHQNTEETVYLKLLTETLDSLHAVYETLKLDNIRKRCSFFTFIFIMFFINLHEALHFLSIL